MEIGATGLDGLPVASHVEQEQDHAQEVAAVPNLLVMENIA